MKDLRYNNYMTLFQRADKRNKTDNEPSFAEKVEKRLANKVHKNDQITEAAYELFLEQGFDAVSIQEIAERAGVAKGTFYLYFHDKDELKEAVITQKSNELFRNALSALHQTGIADFEEQIIFVIDYVLDILEHNQDALRLIAKNLSLGVFSRQVNEFFSDQKTDIVESLAASAERSHIRLKNPEVLLYMIIELASSTCFSCILEAKPLEIAVFKPYLFDAIRQLIRSQQLPPEKSSHRFKRQSRA